MRLITKLSLVAITVGMLSACAETKFVMHTAKRLGETNKSQGDYKVGKPYQVKGEWYYPSENMTYDRTGIASWYGPNFHGKPTANGETFDQWEVSAAHKTLPMPSVVRVTNLVNGRSLVIRINDRGPFKPGRIIDLSRRAAQLLGVEKAGTAQVRVQILPKESRILAERAKAGGAQLTAAQTPIKVEGVGSQAVASQSLPEPPVEKVQSKLYVNPQAAPEQLAIKPAEVEQVVLVDAPVTEAVLPAKVGDVAQVAVSPTRLFIQAGAFSNASNANKVKEHLSTIGDVNVTSVSLGGRDFYRVRIGPLSTVAQVDELLPQVVAAGYGGAQTVVEENVAN